jgi:hypothetical protein
VAYDPTGEMPDDGACTGRAKRLCGCGLSSLPARRARHGAHIRRHRKALISLICCRHEPIRDGRRLSSPARFEDVVSWAVGVAEVSDTFTGAACFDGGLLAGFQMIMTVPIWLGPR